MADVIRPAKEAPVSFDRWLSAALIGDRCGDKDALDFARERKDVATTSTGVLIPQEYQSEWIDLIRQRSVLNAAGITTVTMDAKTANASALVADPSAEWRGSWQHHAELSDFRGSHVDGKDARRCVQRLG